MLSWNTIMSTKNAETRQFQGLPEDFGYQDLGHLVPSKQKIRWSRVMTRKPMQFLSVKRIVRKLYLFEKITVIDLSFFFACWWVSWTCRRVCWTSWWVRRAGRRVCWRGGRILHENERNELENWVVLNQSKHSWLTAGLVGLYAGEVGEYAGLVGEYAGLVGEYAGLVGEY